MPIGMLGSLAICTVLYVLMSLRHDRTRRPTGSSTCRTRWWWHCMPRRSSSGCAAYNIGAIAGLASVVLVMLMGQPRVFFSMSRDGLLPPVFGKVHPRFQTPYVTTILTGSVAAAVAGFFPIAILGELVSIGTLLAFVIVCAGIIVLHYKRPELHRPFRTPFVPLVPILGILSCGGLMATLPLNTWVRLAGVDGAWPRDLLHVQPVALQDRERDGGVATVRRLTAGAGRHDFARGHPGPAAKFRRRPAVAAIRDLLAVLAAEQRVVLSTHINADGDGCGSEAGFARILAACGHRMPASSIRHRGRRCSIFCSDRTSTTRRRAGPMHWRAPT